MTGTTLTLTWTPATTGSAPTSYTVHVGNAPGATTLPVQTTTGTSLSMPITTGGTYFARVRAVNTYGTSVASPEASVTVATPNPKPGAPTGLTASFAGRTISIAWTAPTTGDPVTSYSLEVGSAPGLSNVLVVPMGAGPVVQRARRARRHVLAARARHRTRPAPACPRRISAW